jgi:hypothetical protein
MDLAKFVDLLQRRALYFARSDILGDPFEGSRGIMASADIAEEMIRRRNAGESVSFGTGMSDEQLREVFAQIGKFNRQHREHVFVSCWHMNEHESAAMWSLYSSSSEAICVRTTYSKLAEILPSWTFAGVVNYLDYQSSSFDAGNAFNAFMHKRASFQHERELRAVAWTLASDETGGKETRAALLSDKMGLYVPVELKALIEGVYVSPTSPPWFLEVVNSLLDVYDLPIRAQRSTLVGDPWF